jgi:hypothetical protein
MTAAAGVMGRARNRGINGVTGPVGVCCTTQMSPTPARLPHRTTRLRAGAALIGACAVIAGCSTVINGSPTPAGNPGPITTAPSTTTSVVPATAITGKLLTRNELADIIGDTDLKETATYTKPAYISEGIESPDCAQRLLVNNTFSYYGDDRAAMDGNSNTGASGKVAAQVVSIWATAKSAKQMVSISGEYWGICKDGQPFTVTIDNGTQQWTAGPVAVTDLRITSTVQRQQPTPRTCSHVMARQVNVVVETSVCAGDGDTTGQANQIADKILAKFPH